MGSLPVSPRLAAPSRFSDSLVRFLRVPHLVRVSCDRTKCGPLTERNLSMTLITKAQSEQLIANCQAQIARMDAGESDIDFNPVVKLFTPDAQCTWLLTELGKRRAASARARQRQQNPLHPAARRHA